MTRVGVTLFIILVAILSLNITDTNIVITDTTPPELVNFEVTPTSIDTSTGSATISVRIEASDNFTGFGAGTGTGNGSIEILSPSGQPVGRGSLPITGGTDLEPVFEFDLEFPQFSEQGTWEISLVLIDNLFNSASFSSQDLANMGFPSTIEVTSLEDSTPPRIDNFEVTPLAIDTTSGSATVSVRIEARDEISGFGGAGTGNGLIMIESPSGQPVGRGSLPITGGTNLEPVFEFDLEFPQFSEPGSWDISLTLVDNVFNTSMFNANDLSTLGFPSSVEVTTDPVSVPATCLPLIDPPPTEPPPSATPTPTPTTPGATPMPTSTPTPAPTMPPDPGDLNNDGVPDVDQDNVETIEVDDGSLTVETEDETIIMNFMSADDLINQSPLPPVDIDFLGIFFRFEIFNIEVGGSTEARIILENPVDFDVYYKFGSTPNNPVPHWYEFNFDGETGAQRLSNGDIILHFVDGKRGDNDLAENGRIVDPGGPAVFRVQEPQGESSGGGCSISSGSNMTQSIFNLIIVFLPVLVLLIVRITKNRLLPIIGKSS